MYDLTSSPVFYCYASLQRHKLTGQFPDKSPKREIWKVKIFESFFRKKAKFVGIQQSLDKLIRVHSESHPLSLQPDLGTKHTKPLFQKKRQGEILTIALTFNRFLYIVPRYGLNLTGSKILIPKLG